jgi:hypothetical protein
MKRVLGSSGGTALQFSAQKETASRETRRPLTARISLQRQFRSRVPASPASGAAVFHSVQHIAQMLGVLDPDVVELPQLPI